MKILVIGSEGNIGRKLIPYLRQCGHHIYKADIVQGYGSHYSVVDINHPMDLYNIFSSFKPEIVFNLAAMVSRITCEASPGLTIDTNISGANNVIQLCKIFDAKLISFSTSEVYGNIGGILSENRECKPNNIYGLSKLLGEELVKYEVKNGLKAVIVRPFMFYDEDETLGEHRSAMIRFAESLTKKQKITVHNNSERSWMHINDAVKILEKLMYVDFYIVNIAHSEVVDIKYIARRMCEILGLSYKEYIEEKELPYKMTLTKIPDIELQTKLTGVIPKINIEEGIDLILKKLLLR